MRSVLGDHRKVFLTLGLAVLLVGSVRATRQTVLPLWAEHLGQSPSSTSVVFGIVGTGRHPDLLSLGTDHGPRRAGCGSPCRRCWCWAAAQAALPLTHGLVALTVVAMLMGFGNGIGSGILMTLGADVAPRQTRSQFLGVWRLCADSGSAGGPLVVSAAASLGSLAIGISLMGAVGIAAAGALLRWVPRYSEFATTGTRNRRARVVDVGLPADGGGSRSTLPEQPPPDLAKRPEAVPREPPGPDT